MNKLYLQILLVLGVLGACSETSVLGEDFIDGQNFELTLVDSIQLEMTTVKFDSIVTSEGNRLIIGNHMTHLGRINSDAYFLISNDPEGSGEVEDTYVYDSTTLTLTMDGYTSFLDDEGLRRTLVVERLSEELEYSEDFSLYNVSEPLSDEGFTTELGRKEFFWASDRVREVEVPINQVFGFDLYQRLRDVDEIFTDQIEFSQYVKGFRVRFVEESTPYIGMRVDSTFLTIHATDNSTTPPTAVEYKLFAGSQPYFSKIEHTDELEPFEAIESIEDEVSSSETGNVGYINGGVGYAIKMSLGAVSNLLLSETDFILSGAELRLDWFETDHEVKPEQLEVRYVDEDYIDLTGEPAYFQLVEDEFNRDNHYLLDLDLLNNDVLEQLLDEELYLLITTEDFLTSVHSVFLGDETFNSELRLYTISNK